MFIANSSFLSTFIMAPLLTTDTKLFIHHVAFVPLYRCGVSACGHCRKDADSENYPDFQEETYPGHAQCPQSAFVSDSTAGRCGVFSCHYDGLLVRARAFLAVQHLRRSGAVRGFPLFHYGTDADLYCRHYRRYFRTFVQVQVRFPGGRGPAARTSVLLHR